MTRREDTPARGGDALRGETCDPSAAPPCARRAGGPAALHADSPLLYDIGWDADWSYWFARLGQPPPDLAQGLGLPPLQHAGTGRRPRARGRRRTPGADRARVGEQNAGAPSSTARPRLLFHSTPPAPPTAGGPIRQPSRRADERRVRARRDEHAGCDADSGRPRREHHRDHLPPAWRRTAASVVLPATSVTIRDGFLQDGVGGFRTPPAQRRPTLNRGRPALRAPFPLRLRSRTRPDDLAVRPARRIQQAPARTVSCEVDNRLVDQTFSRHLAPTS